MQRARLKFKIVIGKSQSFQMKPVVEPTKEDRMDFAEPFQDKLDKDACILVAVDKWSNSLKLKCFQKQPPI